jgi:hypothetical protein
VTLKVSCPGVQSNISAIVATAEGTAPVRGIVLAFSAGQGSHWYGDEPVAEAGLARLRDAGITTVMVRWAPPGWLAAAPGEQAGPAALACRPATVIRYAYDKWFVPLGVEGGLARCGFCLTGTSSGSSQIAYALTFYGLDGLVDVLVPSSGPPHAAIRAGCEGVEGYDYDAESRASFDSSYGFYDGTGPCTLGSPDWGPRFDADSVDLGGTSYLWPTTRVHAVFGGADTTPAPRHGQDFLTALLAAGSPMVSAETVPGVSHAVQHEPAGMAAIVAALIG